MNVFFEGSMHGMLVALLGCVAILVELFGWLVFYELVLARVKKNIYNDEVEHEFGRCVSSQRTAWFYYAVSLFIVMFAIVAVVMSLYYREDSLAMIIFMLAVSLTTIGLVAINVYVALRYWRWELKPLKEKLGSGARSDYARKTGSIPIIPDK